MANVLELERQIFEKEGVRVVIRCLNGAIFDDYTYIRRASDNTSINEFLSTRIMPYLQDKIGASAVVVDGYGNTPYSSTYLSTVRKTYGL